VKKAREKILKRLKIRRLSQYSIQIFGCGGLGHYRHMPINQALRLAVERYGLHMDMAAREEEERYEAVELYQETAESSDNEAARERDADLWLPLTSYSYFPIP
jgi:D-arabinose 1-dehydrogenase-like Zn-dependent alcohol dehydrogenase